MRKLLGRLLDTRDPMPFKRRAAITLGFQGQLLITLLVGVCAMGPRNPEKFLYVPLTIAAGVWLQLLFALTIHYKNKVWPANALFLTASIYLSGGCSIAFHGQLFEYRGWLLGFFWLCTCATAIACLIETLKHDFQIFLFKNASRTPV